MITIAAHVVILRVIPQSNVNRHTDCDLLGMSGFIFFAWDGDPGLHLVEIPQTAFLACQY